MAFYSLEGFKLDNFEVLLRWIEAVRPEVAMAQASATPRPATV